MYYIVKYKKSGNVYLMKDSSREYSSVMVLQVLHQHSKRPHDVGSVLGLQFLRNENDIEIITGEETDILEQAALEAL